MEYTTIMREADAFQQPVPQDRIEAMCQRAFGPNAELVAIKELGGGEHNNTYLITFNGIQPVILRVSPAAKARLSKDEVGLMRREHYMQPFLAPINRLMPRTLMVDFTHHLIERDYIFQTCMDGESWVAIEDELSWEEDLTLYHQLGTIAKTINSIEGKTFGIPFTDHTYATWSDYIIDDLESHIRRMEAVSIDATDIRELLKLAQTHIHLLEEITCPRLLHGDLWTFNVLVKRGRDTADGQAKISAVLDSDRCWWGDPLADWTMFLLYFKSRESLDPKVVAGTRAFWEAYGALANDQGTQFRMNIYRGLNFGGARLDLYRRHNHERLRQTYDRLREIHEALREIL